jgi:hypothetical protein
VSRTKRVTVVAALCIVVLSLSLLGSIRITTAIGTSPNQPSREFLNSRFVTNKGVRAGETGCRFPGYKLTLPPGQKEIEARQVSVDYNNCVELIEIGTPTEDVEEVPAVEYSEATEYATETNAGNEPSSATSDNVTFVAQSYHSVRYEVWWEDIVNADLTKTWAKLSFYDIDNCVYSSLHSAYYWWLSGTGWKKISSSVSRYRGTYGWCAPTPDEPTRSWYVYTIVDAHYQNVGAFCGFLETNNFYNDVTVAGYHDGSIDGWVHDTWVVEPPVCPPLHWHSKLVG